MIKIHRRGRLLKITAEAKECTITLYCQSASSAHQRKIALVGAIKTAICANISEDIIMNNIWANTITQERGL